MRFFHLSLLKAVGSFLGKRVHFNGVFTGVQGVRARGQGDAVCVDSLGDLVEVRSGIGAFVGRDRQLRMQDSPADIQVGAEDFQEKPGQKPGQVETHLECIEFRVGKRKPVHQPGDEQAAPKTQTQQQGIQMAGQQYPKH